MLYSMLYSTIHTPALLAGIPDFNTEVLEALLRCLPVPDDTRQPAGMTMAEAVKVSDPL